MNRPRITITVYGRPAPQGSKRHVGNGVMVESSKAVKPWREDVKLAALRALDQHPEWDRGHRALYLSATFTLPRPRSHYRTGKLSGVLRDDAPILHSVAPDLDKLLRSTGDALTAAGVYTDDSRVAVLNASKCYPTPLGCYVFDQPGRLDRPGAVLVLEPR